MKKIVFVDIPMQRKNKMNYCGMGNVKSSYDKEVLYPVNAVLAQKTLAGEELKIVLLETKNNEDSHDEQTKENARIFEEEIKAALAGKGAKVEVIHLDSDFDESKENHEVRFRKMLDVLEEKCELYADITFGPRLLPMLLLCVFNFAERFFDCRVKGMFYGKTLHDLDDNMKLSAGALYDVSPLYYLNNLTNSMQASSGEDAKEALDEFFAL